MSDLDQLGIYPFERLRHLLRDIPTDIPTDAEGLNLSIGEPQVAPPAFVAETIAGLPQDWNRYPPIPGTPELNQAIHDWLCRRFGLRGAATAFGVDPTCGAREGIFLLAMLTRFCDKPAARRHLIAVPNPGYAVYAGSIRIAGGEVYPLDTHKGVFPNPDQLDVAVLKDLRLVYLCSPDNPSGEVVPETIMRAWIKAARRYDFLVAGDECYSELYATTPPRGILEVAASMASEKSLYNRVIALNSLSKRSSCAGLRSGLLAGDPEVIVRIGKIKAFAGNRMPLALQAASVKLWSDEGHVALIRRHYQANYDLTNRLFADWSGFKPVQAGMFLWLPVADELEVAKRLWREAGLRTLPGRFLCESRQTAPGENFLRVALVHDLAVLTPALENLRRLITD